MVLGAWCFVLTRPQTPPPCGTEVDCCSPPLTSPSSRGFASRNLSLRFSVRRRGSPEATNRHEHLNRHLGPTGFLRKVFARRLRVVPAGDLRLAILLRSVRSTRFARQCVPKWRDCVKTPARRRPRLRSRASLPVALPSKELGNERAGRHPLHAKWNFAPKCVPKWSLGTRVVGPTAEYAYACSQPLWMDCGAVAGSGAGGRGGRPSAEGRHPAAPGPRGR